jgi:DNA adenine methylase
MAEPFLKWAGGKRQLAPEIVRRAPARFGRYHEPFLGGGAVFFALRSAQRAECAVLTDANADLCECFKVVRDSVEALIEVLAHLADGYLGMERRERSDFYYEQRAAEPATAVERAARLIFLNRTCYNGLYRVNRSGKFNGPHGRYANPGILDEERLRAASTVLKGARIQQGDFGEACRAAEAGDFVYLDPPYQPLSETSKFTSYTAGQFGLPEQQRLRDEFEALTRGGVAALLSNSDHTAIVDLYKGRGLTLERVPMSRAINSVAARRSPIDELLISNFERPEVREAFGG